MKKRNLIILIILLNVVVANAQETFVRKYTKCISKVNEKLSDWEEIDLTVVFNEKKTNNVVLYYPNKTIILYKIGSVEASKTNSGDEYQLVECIDGDGEKVILQLFYDAMRLIIRGSYIEFHQ